MTQTQDTITGALARAVARIPDYPFLDVLGERFTYRQFDDLTTEVAHGLRAAGVGKGDPVSVLLDNGPEILVLWFAANKLGAIFAPINSAFKGAYLVSQLNDTGPGVVVVEADYAGRVSEILAETPTLKRVYVVGGDESRTVAGVAFQPFAALRSGDRTSIPDEAAPDDLCMLVYTSGTTGPSKGCMLPHNMLCNAGKWTLALHGYRGDDVIWNCLPLFHVNAMISIITAILGQCRVAYAKRFSVSNFWSEVERSGATSVNLLGSMPTLLANAPDDEAAARCRGQLRVVMAVPFSPEDAAIWRERFGVTAKGAVAYGLSEALTVCGVAPGEPPGPLGSSGHGGIDFDVQIVDDNDNILPPGVVGEIACRPLKPNIMFKGYWNKPEETVRVWRNLWFHTGDLGKLDEQGWFYFVDRKKDYIRRRGENISSTEVERVFLTHPAIKDAAVHAVRTPDGEEEVKVTAELEPGVTVSEEELCRWSIERLPYFVVPLYIEFREVLPRGPTGRVLKDQLRREGKTAATWDREAAGLKFARR
jgi:crotonobetaine/carnitine-CoA ligase